ncbi:MAG: hypothetical protein U1E65_07130 [Myxococcota bacterium]
MCTTLFFALGFAACGSTTPAGNKDATTSTNKDATTDADGGNQMGMDATQQGMDAGPGMDVPMGSDTGLPAQDSGVMMGACDPIANTGCTAPEICVFVPNLRMAQCRMPVAMPKTFEQVCTPANNDCAAGLTCLQFQGEANPTCRQNCNPNGGVDRCAGLAGTSSTGYACLAGIQGVNDIAFCAAKPADCVPYNDMCPMNQNCERISQTMVGCIPSGPTQNGGTCGTAMTSCATGNCLDIGSGPTCYEACNAAMPACSNQGICIGLQGASFGLCAQHCDVFNDTCMNGNNCNLLQAGAACLPGGNQMAGAACSQQMNCARGLLCVNQACHAPCDATHTCATGMCQMLQGLNFGVCI